MNKKSEAKSKPAQPPYQEVLFYDKAANFMFVCGSTLQPKTKMTFEGKEYPVVFLSVSTASHPFFTGSNVRLDAAGRIEKFNQRYAPKAPAPQKPAAPEAPVKKAKKKA